VLTARRGTARACGPPDHGPVAAAGPAGVRAARPGWVTRRQGAITPRLASGRLDGCSARGTRSPIARNGPPLAGSAGPRGPAGRVATSGSGRSAPVGGAVGPPRRCRVARKRPWTDEEHRVPPGPTSGSRTRVVGDRSQRRRQVRRPAGAVQAAIHPGWHADPIPLSRRRASSGPDPLIGVWQAAIDSCEGVGWLRRERATSRVRAGCPPRLAARHASATPASAEVEAIVDVCGMIAAVRRTPVPPPRWSWRTRPPSRMSDRVDAHLAPGSRTADGSAAAGSVGRRAAPRGVPRAGRADRVVRRLLLDHRREVRMPARPGRRRWPRVAIEPAPDKEPDARPRVDARAAGRGQAPRLPEVPVARYWVCRLTTDVAGPLLVILETSSPGPATCARDDPPDRSKRKSRSG